MTWIWNYVNTIQYSNNTTWNVYFLTKQSYSSFTLNRETVWKVNPPMEKIKLIIDGFCQYFCQLWKRISDVHLVVLFSPEILKEAKTFLKLYLNNWIRFSYSISAMVRTKFKVLFTAIIFFDISQPEDRFLYFFFNVSKR